jgi:hypothetical protein
LSTQRLSQCLQHSQHLLPPASQLQCLFLSTQRLSQCLQHSQHLLPPASQLQCLFLSTQRLSQCLQHSQHLLPPASQLQCLFLSTQRLNQSLLQLIFPRSCLPRDQLLPRRSSVIRFLIFFQRIILTDNSGSHDAVFS